MRRRISRTAFSIFLWVCFSIPGYSEHPPVVQPQILRSMPHVSRGFTQGLCFAGTLLYEGTGLHHQSGIYEIRPEDGSIKRFIPTKKYFGEGIAILNHKLIQLTWRGKTALAYSFPGLERTDSLSYEGEGWGLTHDSVHYIMSNGSDTLFFRDSAFALRRKLPVTANGKPVTNLNELEFAENRILANIWHRNYLLEIDPSTGRALRMIDCRALAAIERPQNREQVLNGIAYNPVTRTLFVTGKHWNLIFEISIPWTAP
ncbi:glutaminyl-peptide cyclotransferase [Fibrobacterota bacterium]